MMLSKSRYELWKTSAKIRYQFRKLPVVDLDCSTSGFSVNNHEQPSIKFRTNSQDNTPEFHWFTYFVRRNNNLFPDCKGITSNAMNSCREATSNLDPEDLKSTTNLKHWFKVTTRGKALQESETCSFWFLEENESLVEDKRLIRALLDLKCVLFYYLDQFLENYLIWEKKEELPEMISTCSMYILQSEQPSFPLGCLLVSASTFEWFLFWLNNHSSQFPHYHRLVSDAKDPCNKFTSAVLRDLNDQTPISEPDAPEENDLRLESWARKYPDDCLLQFSMTGDVIQGRKITISPRFNIPLQWSALQDKKEFEGVKKVMKSVQSIAQRYFFVQTENTRRRLREDTSSPENADTEGPSTLQITAKNMQETELLAGFNTWQKSL